MDVFKSEFVASSPNVRNCPNELIPEFAFIGRSNVGKSSLINSICKKKKIAKVSGKPGKTQLINHFLINENFYFADLPGYGYAKVSKKEREKFQKFTLKYLENRTNLICLFLLIDLRHPPQEIDIEFMEYCAMKRIPFVLCFTKADKLKKIELKINVENYKSELLKNWEEFPEYFVSSSVKSLGIDELLSFISSYNKDFKP